MNHNGNQIEARLWDAADELRANSKLKSSDTTGAASVTKAMMRMSAPQLGRT